MMQRVKKYLLLLTCVAALFGCDIPTPDPTPADKPVQLESCWHLVKYYGVAVDADIFIDFGEDGKFVIYQRTEELTYTVFNGTYTADKENGVVSGVYDDGTPWLCDYNYVVDTENKLLTMTNVDNSSEVSVYESSEVPTSATLSSRAASAYDVKPL